MNTTILVVEDHDDSREILSTQLKYLGYEVIEAMTGEEGVEKALCHLPHVVIMDIGLPGISGLEATQRLKENPRTAHIPVIAHTAWGEETFRTAGEKAGISEFLTKPTHPKKFQNTIERCLGS
jgi:CheY-like chemotaxis protein